MNWRFFQRIIGFALDEDWPILCSELERIEMTNVQRFIPLPIDAELILGPHQSFNGSTHQMLSDFLATDNDTCLILEGDCVFKDLTHIETALSELPLDWAAFALFRDMGKER